MSAFETVLAIILGSLTLLLIVTLGALGILDLIENIRYRRTRR